MKIAIRVGVVGMLLASAAVSEIAGQWDALDASLEQVDVAYVLREFPSLADKGDADAQLVLGTLYFRGKGVPQNYTEAAKWLQKAAEQGNIPAKALLGHLYENGLGVQQGAAEAVQAGGASQNTPIPAKPEPTPATVPTKAQAEDGKIVTTPKQTAVMMVAVRAYLADNLNDPDSLKLAAKDCPYEVKVIDGTTPASFPKYQLSCFYRAKNGYGGYARGLTLFTFDKNLKITDAYSK